jgi:hypothetical protein
MPRSAVAAISPLATPRSSRARRAARRCAVNSASTPDACSSWTAADASWRSTRLVPGSSSAAKLSVRKPTRSPENEPVSRAGTIARAPRAIASATTAPLFGHHR